VLTEHTLNDSSVSITNKHARLRDNINDSNTTYEKDSIHKDIVECNGTVASNTSAAEKCEEKENKDREQVIDTESDNEIRLNSIDHGSR